MTETTEPRARAAGRLSGPASPAGTMFDAHHPPAQELVDACVHCGFCVPACPSNLVFQTEMDSPPYLMDVPLRSAANLPLTVHASLVSVLGHEFSQTQQVGGAQIGRAELGEDPWGPHPPVGRDLAYEAPGHAPAMHTSGGNGT